ncbi:hypothetical protein CYY_005974 [Polysphondylium violaceum]|uniref:Uncharacterized protein n=1 Tax=Polysphondylium violaceum TaxID=133409 RepID=A0A8J4PUI2_9MYCE|nr:hypothetical protein CYY_005974 [Polysphondylium violaceum]
MKILKESSLGNIRLLSSFLLITFLFITLYSQFFKNIDYCAVDRVYSGDKWRHLHLMLSFGCVLFCGLQFVFWSPLKPRSLKAKFQFNGRSLFFILYTLLWYGATYCLCTYLKVSLGDLTCNKHSNSVSGHFLFHSFYLLIIPYWFLTMGRIHNKQQLLSPSSHPDHQKKTSKRQQQQQSSSSTKRAVRESSRNELVLLKRLLVENPTTIVLLITYLLYVYSSYINLDKTWVHGFHSPRQILYGLLLSFSSILALLQITSVYNNLQSKSSYIGLLQYLVGYWILALSVLYYGGGRYPFSNNELIVFFVCFLYLVYFSLVKAETLPQPQTEEVKLKKKNE